mgnify:CR=1 FL=1
MLNVNLNSNTPWSSGVPYKILNVLGGSDKTLVVGGAVRDWLRNSQVVDIDFATKILPKEASKLLSAAGFEVRPIGIDYGTIALFENKTSYEITTLRKDVLTDGRHAKVVFGDNWLEDALRRDFTVNALYADEYGNIKDPTGLGFKDLKNKKLRFIGKPEARIKEDYLRIIRYFRLISKFSNNIDNSSMNACIKYAKNINLLSGERITNEFNKIFIDKNFLKIIEFLLDYNIFKYIYSIEKLNDCKINKNYLKNINNKFIKNKNSYNKSFLLFTALILGSIKNDDGNIKSYVEGVSKRLRFSKNDEMLLLKKVNWIMKIHCISKFDIYRIWLDNGKDAIESLQEIYYILGVKIEKEIKIVLNRAPPKFPCTGQDAIDVGFKEGKDVGKAIKNLKNWWITNDCKKTYFECKQILKEEFNKL